MCDCVCVITFSGDTDDIDLMAHYSTGREELLTEDCGLDPNLEPVQREEGGSQMCDRVRSSSFISAVGSRVSLIVI